MAASGTLHRGRDSEVVVAPTALRQLCSPVGRSVQGDPGDSRPTPPLRQAEAKAEAEAKANVTMEAQQQRQRQQVAEVEEGIASSLICPITQELMTDPVFTMDGQTYERTAIEAWLKTHDTAPATGKRLPSKKLVDNVSARGMVRELLERQPKLAVALGAVDEAAPPEPSPLGEPATSAAAQPRQSQEPMAARPAAASLNASLSSMEASRTSHPCPRYPPRPPPDTRTNAASTHLPRHDYACSALVDPVAGGGAHRFGRGAARSSQA